jgi:NADPH-dependent ferric siderophore reductase
MDSAHEALNKNDPADVAVETTSATWYRFDKVAMPALATALEKAKDDATTLALLNLDGAAIVIPWRIVRSVHAANALETFEVEDGENVDDLRTWELLWERDTVAVTEPARVFNEQ